MRILASGRPVIGKIPRQMVERLSWTTGSFGIIQLMRFANNVVLARLLSPPLFGLMLIVNSIRTGVELLSDVGINQNIISNRQGHTPEFYDTAWTIKVIRGVVLGAVCFASAGLFASFFGKPGARDNPAGHRADFPVHGLPVRQRSLAAKAEIRRPHQPVRHGHSDDFPGRRTSCSH